MNAQSRKIAEDQRDLIEFRVDHLQAVMRRERIPASSQSEILEEIQHLRSLHARLERELAA